MILYWRAAAWGYTHRSEESSVDVRTGHATIKIDGVPRLIRLSFPDMGVQEVRNKMDKAFR